MESNYKCLMVDFNNGEGKEVYVLELLGDITRLLAMFDQYEELNPTITLKTISHSEYIKALEAGESIA